MVPATSIIFHCPHCQVRLNVPARLAGVTGPCPKCREAITAPMESEAIPESLPEVPAAVPVPEGPKIRPEPRQLPERGHAAPISPRRSTEDDLLRPRPVAYLSRGSRPSRMFHSLLPASFIAAAGVLVYLLLYFYYPDGPGRKLREAQGPLAVSPRVTQNPVAPSPAPHSRGGAVAPVEELPPAPAPEQPVDEISPAVAANNVLDAFLKAKNATERVEMVEPATSAQDLEQTLLKGPLAEVAQVFSDLPRQNSVEGFTDYPYRVSFFVQGRPNTDFAVLVRQRGKQPPRVFLPAFLDLVGGRLSAFTRQPNNEEPARFHAILEPVIGCHEDGIPNADRKFTLKLLSSNFGKETARAYCSNNSRFREMVEKPDYPIRWGIRVPATVTIQWNHKEDPTMPYLELIDINSPDWNP
ncbi:hypothetical protein [Luteolibacter soli]|uniref:Zinc finger/thioredoxin putative domain-containing protein n=1 Tax=Luteolibacter soli TaxID=3135280 RepID=A0ABU9AXM4_9BACT